ncbi:MAG: hypothetical protein CPDRYMAC_0061 [uncultured Paraburkholderia sp.]|nr:MAG: hypothetical protein CPDRYDRY_0060 [uncultured Paraburkholderia sp.]CAH2909735.1 MAG: hypothetical protein CPDRYMAC_0061 [uncultured Paraburkholderia sp.]
MYLKTSRFECRPRAPESPLHQPHFSRKAGPTLQRMAALGIILKMLPVRHAYPAHAG